jgi:DNA repair exonuclease SbcCD ATPase subunit
MEPLSQQLADLSAQAKKAEDRVAKAQSEVKERIEQQREQVREETTAALKKVSDNVAQASEATQGYFEQLKAKVDSDLQQLREKKAEFHAWQAGNYADAKATDAAVAIGYAIAATKLAELATLEAIEARARAEIKAELAQPAQA